MSDVYEGGRFEESIAPEHYYGDKVRKLFLAAGAIMIVTYAFFETSIDVPAYAAVLIILLLVIFAGVQSPRHFWVKSLNAVISIVACGIIEYKAVVFYQTAYADSPQYFWTDQVLALLFFFAIYYSMKTVRGSLVGKR